MNNEYNWRPWRTKGNLDKNFFALGLNLGEMEWFLEQFNSWINKYVLNI